MKSVKNFSALAFVVRVWDVWMEDWVCIQPQKLNKITDLFKWGDAITIKVNNNKATSSLIVCLHVLMEKKILICTIILKYIKVDFKIKNVGVAKLRYST